MARKVIIYPGDTLELNVKVSIDRKIIVEDFDRLTLDLQRFIKTYLKKSIRGKYYVQEN